MIDIITDASEMFKIPNIVLKDTPIVERPGFEYVHVDKLVEF